MVLLLFMFFQLYLNNKDHVPFMGKSRAVEVNKIYLACDHWPEASSASTVSTKFDRAAEQIDLSAAASRQHQRPQHLRPAVCLFDGAWPFPEFGRERFLKLAKCVSWIRKGDSWIRKGVSWIRQYTFAHYTIWIRHTIVKISNTSATKNQNNNIFSKFKFLLGQIILQSNLSTTSSR